MSFNIEKLYMPIINYYEHISFFFLTSRYSQKAIKCWHFTNNDTYMTTFERKYKFGIAIKNKISSYFALEKYDIRH